jgi:hypothetical protein
MNEEGFRTAVLTEPFEPVRIHLNDDTTIDILQLGAHRYR